MTLRVPWAAIYEEFQRGSQGSSPCHRRAEAQVLVSHVSTPCWTSPHRPGAHLDAALACGTLQASARTYLAMRWAMRWRMRSYTCSCCCPDGLTRTDIYNAFGRNKKSTSFSRRLPDSCASARDLYTEATEGRSIERGMLVLHSPQYAKKRI